MIGEVSTTQIWTGGPRGGPVFARAPIEPVAPSQRGHRFGSDREPQIIDMRLIGDRDGREGRMTIEPIEPVARRPARPTPVHGRAAAARPPSLQHRSAELPDAPFARVSQDSVYRRTEALDAGYTHRGSVFDFTI